MLHAQSIYEEEVRTVRVRFMRPRVGEEEKT